MVSIRLDHERRHCESVLVNITIVPESEHGSSSEPLTVFTSHTLGSGIGTGSLRRRGVSQVQSM